MEVKYVRRVSKMGRVRRGVKGGERGREGKTEVRERRQMKGCDEWEERREKIGDNHRIVQKRVQERRNGDGIGSLRGKKGEGWRRTRG